VRNQEPPDPEPGQDILARPFLSDPRVSGPTPAAGSTGPDDGEVRPYLMTGGRTQTDPATAVAIETVVVALPLATDKHLARIRFERADILELCRVPRSVAEVSALLRLPLGVARVLVADLVAEGLLEASSVRPRQAFDVPFLERLIDGVSAL
jgi:Protein of unknown function (DUF742)